MVSGRGHFLAGAVLLLVLSNLSSALDPKPQIVTTDLDAYVATTYELSCEIKNVISTLTPTWEFRCVKCKSFQTVSTGLIPDDQQTYGLKIPGNNIYILQVKNVNVNNTGSYRCAVQFSTYVKIADTVNVRVVQKPQIDPMVTSHDTSIEIGRPVSLTCGAYGAPYPRIKWERAGRGMFPSGGFVYVGERLDFPLVDISHNGPYVCTAVNDVGTTTRIINLKVDSPPLVTITTRRPTQIPGYKLKLMCEVFSNPVITGVIWYRVGGGERKTLTDDDDRFSLTQFQAGSGKLLSKLIVNGVIEADFGATYECESSNRYGTSTATTTITRASEAQKMGCYPVQAGSHLVASSLLLLFCVISHFLYG